MKNRMALLLSNLFERLFTQGEMIADRYKVLHHLGEGGYGHSYLVDDLICGQNKVLKALRLHKRMTEKGREEFELEKSLLHAIDHPGFPKYFEEGTYKSVPFYTMEYIEGKNFEQIIFSEGRKISELEAFRIVFGLLEPIEYLHLHKIIHRDIRIPNVISDGTKIRLIDLGLGRQLDSESGDRSPREFNLRKEINFQADFYGLGHFLLFLLYSNFSFPENKRETSWDQELDISNEAKHIIRRLLQIETEYGNCAEIRADIKNLYLI